MREHLYPYQRGTLLFQPLLPAEAVHPAAKTRHPGEPAALGQLLGQLLHHLELLEQAVHIHHLEPAAGGDAPLAAGVEDLGIFPLQGSHGEDDGLGVGHLLFVDAGAGELLAQAPGQHPGDLAQVAHAPQLLELLVVVLKSEAVLAELFLQLSGLLFVVVLLGLLDEGEHIAHAQDPGGHPVGVEGLDHVQLLAGAHEFDGLAGGGPDGEGRAAPGVAVQLGEDHAVDAQRLVEGGGRVDGVLAGHGVHHQQNLVGMDGGLHPLELVHQLLVHVETAGGIQKDDVVAVVPGVAQGVLRDLYRVSLALLKDGQVQLSAHDLELLDGGGPVHVAGGQQGPLAVLPPQ